MELAGVAVALGSVMYMISKRVSMGLSLILGTCIAGLLSGIGLQKFGVAIVQGLMHPTTIELVIAVVLISGLGKLMKESGDLELMIDSLVAMFPNPKLLTMILPALIGTLNVPGGAIMSAPMVEENGKMLGLAASTKTAVNIFYRHIGYYVYPLYASLIILSELMNVQKLVLIRYNLITMLVGISVAYLVFFRGAKYQTLAKRSGHSTARNIINFFLGFSPILVALGLVLIFELPFYIAIAIGLLIGLLRRLPDESRRDVLKYRVRELFASWIDYKLVLVIMGLMMFKAVIEASGVVNTLAESLFSYGIPLPMMVVTLGLLTSYLTGAHMAASGILATLFIPLLPPTLVGPYSSLLFTAIMLGYLISPIHLCLVLTNDYFGSKYGEFLRQLSLPALAMLATAFIQLLLNVRGVV